MVYQVPEFTCGNISLKKAAEIMKKDQQFIRQGMVQGILPIGTVYKKGGKSQYDYYMSKKYSESILTISTRVLNRKSKKSV